ncbi:MAG TPA: hypothetical protein VD994_14405, partial [Prosthecobacter sp.]|nr:hypothetical protein [Prosthecobacter sp.]
HRGGLLVPSGFGDILWNMAIGAELAGPDAGAGQPKVYLVSADNRALQAAKQDLEVYSLSRQTIHWEILDLAAHPALANIPGHRLEFLIYDPHVVEQVRAGGAPLTTTETFPALWSGWASQSYFDTGKLDNRYPTLADLRLLRFASWFIYLLVFGLIGSAGYGTYSLFAAMNHPSWQLTTEQVGLTKGKHAKLMAERKQIDVTKRLLLPRSRGWVTLEFLLQLFPEDSGVRLENFSYVVESARPAAVGKKVGNSEYTGLSRTWSFKGLVKPKAMELLSTLNSQRGLKAFFERVAEATGDASYKPEADRQLTVTLTQGRNNRFDSQATAGDLARDPSLSYPFSFEATISQTMTAKDELALPIQKPF